MTIQHSSDKHPNGLSEPEWTSQFIRDNPYNHETRTGVFGVARGEDGQRLILVGSNTDYSDEVAYPNYVDCTVIEYRRFNPHIQHAVIAAVLK